MRALITVGIAAALAACAAAPKGEFPRHNGISTPSDTLKVAVEGNDAPDDTYCYMEHPTGSHMFAVVCMSAQERERQRRDAQRTVLDAIRHGGPPGPEGQ
jgi:hypothetical protein